MTDSVRLVLLGPPGAGKGTQAVRLAARFGVPHVSTGDIFRANIQQATPLGREAQAFYDHGELVPDDLVNRMVADRLADPDAADGFLLDGYPRTVGQAEALERVAVLDAVLDLVVPEAELLARLARRREVEDRSDDSDETIRTRLEEYRAKTAPLQSYYDQRGLLRQIDAVGDIDDVTARAVTVLEQA